MKVIKESLADSDCIIMPLSIKSTLSVRANVIIIMMTIMMIIEINKIKIQEILLGAFRTCKNIKVNTSEFYI